jgi:hypothetical protein
MPSKALPQFFIDSEEDFRGNSRGGEVAAMMQPAERKDPDGFALRTSVARAPNESYG